MATWPADGDENWNTTMLAYLAVEHNTDGTHDIVGSSIQVVNTQTGAVATGTTIMPDDDTIPQKTEGDEYMNLAITPTNASNKLKIDVIVSVSHSAIYNTRISVGIFQDATNNALAAISKFWDVASQLKHISFSHYMDAGTTSETTFKVRIGSFEAGTLTFNGIAGARKMGGVMASSITITEIKV